MYKKPGTGILVEGPGGSSAVLRSDVDAEGWSRFIGHPFQSRQQTASVSSATIDLDPERQSVVIGRLDDLRNLKRGERSLLDRLPYRGNFRENWKQNTGVLRQEMAKRNPIRDTSPGDNVGHFLNAERNLLRDRGWTFDPNTNYWKPPNQ